MCLSLGLVILGFAQYVRPSRLSYDSFNVNKSKSVPLNAIQACGYICP